MKEFSYQVENTILELCKTFVRSPYICYTEHGFHTYFIYRLIEHLPEEERFIIFNDERVCRVQKEYPTFRTLGKSKRQNWDIAVLSDPNTEIEGKNLYDYQFIDSVIEFGLNATEEHLREDARRLSHEDSNVKSKFIVHMYRISDGFSSRDMPPESPRILSIEKVAEIMDLRDVVTYYALADKTGRCKNGVWRCLKGDIREL